MEGVPANGKQEVDWQALDQKSEHNMEQSRSVAENEEETRGMERRREGWRGIFYLCIHIYMYV